MRRIPMLVLACVCACYHDAAPPPHRDTPVETTQRAPLTVQSTQPEPTREGELYAMDEALADALSGPLQHIGTGAWFGLFRVNACAYRNQRVIVVNVYCTTNEMKAFSIVVLSPTRGRAVIYAEADAPISTLKRGDYFTFKGEANVPPDSSLRPLSLGFGYDELTTWDEKRYNKYLPGCFGGVEIKRPQSGCLKPFEAKAATWKDRNQPFFDDPPEDWYRIVREMRERAKRDGKHIAHPGG